MSKTPSPVADAHAYGDPVVDAIEPLVVGVLNLIADPNATRSFVHSPLVGYLYGGSNAVTMSAATAASSDPDLSRFITGHGDYGPFLRTTWGHGFRMPPSNLAAAIIDSTITSIAIDGDELTPGVLRNALAKTKGQMREALPRRASTVLSSPSV